MRTRRKQIAIIIVITICMCNLQHSQRNPIYSEAVTSDFLYNEGDLIVPIWVDLSDKNVKTTGKNLIVESPPVFSDISLAKYYSSVKFYYSIKVKDEKEQEKAKISDEKWYCNTITCHFEWGGNYSVSNVTTNTYEQQISLQGCQLYPYGGDETYPYRFCVDLNSSYKDKDGKYTWPLEVEELQIQSIEFVPYENARYAEPLTTITPTQTPYEEMETPYPKREANIDKNPKVGPVKNYSVNLERFQTTFHNSWIHFGFGEELNSAWHRPENYSQIKIQYKLEYNNLGKISQENLLKNIKFDVWSPLSDTNGWKACYIDLKYTRIYVDRPFVKNKDVVLEVVIPLCYKQIENNKEVIKSIFASGINIQPFSYSGTWPKELEKLTVTGIELVAKNGATYPQKVIPTLTPNIPTSESPILQTPSVPQKVTNLKLKAGKKKQIKLSWEQVKSADGYEVYRSVRKNRGFYKIADGLKNKNGFTDVKVNYAKNYYYKVRAYRINENLRTYGTFSNVKKQVVKRRAPSFTLQRKITPDGIKYVSVRIKSWSDPYLQMWVQVGNKKYKRIPLAKKKIKKKNITLNFKYSGGKTKIKFCICTYRIRKNKKEYSESKVKQI